MRARIILPILAAMALAVTVPHTAPAQDTGSDPGQSIQVHGHWIIEVYDGEDLVQRREFENALATGADGLISDLLAGNGSAGPWIITLDHCRVHNGSAYGCPLNTTATAPSEGDNAGALVLEASTTISDDGTSPDTNLTMSSVTTQLNTCDAATAPTDCTTTDAPASFTIRLLDPAIPIEAGQDVNATVIISFTSG